MRQGLKTKMSFRDGFPRGFLNRAGLSRYPRLQAKTGACSVQWSSISVSLSGQARTSVLEQISERMQDKLSLEVGLPVVEVLDDSLPSEELRG